MSVRACTYRRKVMYSNVLAPKIIYQPLTLISILPQLAKTFKKNIPPTERHFSDYLKDPNQESFFIQTTTAEEIKDIIMTLMGSKDTGPNNSSKKN